MKNAGKRKAACVGRLFPEQLSTASCRKNHPDFESLL